LDESKLGPTDARQRGFAEVEPGNDDVENRLPYPLTRYESREKHTLGLRPRVSFMLPLRFLERQMNAVLIIALATACVVNVACLFGHL
jgi:hypothetical protein